MCRLSKIDMKKEVEPVLMGDEPSVCGLAKSGWTTMP